ncbi:MAG: AAA-like domain-containing protein [Candidatus Hodarchaeota archaeon]
MPKLNPFRYGKPVPPDKHIDREANLQVLFSRIANYEATALVGEPHIGKSSIIRYIQHIKVKREWLDDPERYIFIDVDCHQFPDDYMPIDFWKRMMGIVWRSASNEEIRRKIDFAAKQDFGTYALEQVLNNLSEQERYIILLLDEFERIFRCPNLFTPEFLGALRSLSSRTDSLIPIITSRRSLAAFNRAGRELIAEGSPLFNNYVEVRLTPFSDEDVQELVTQSLIATDIRFDKTDMRYLKTIAGGNPFLIQMAAAGLFDAIVAGKKGKERYLMAAQSFHRRSGSHFDDFWEHLEPEAQTALVILAMGELKGQVDGRNFSTTDIGNLELFSPELERLAEQGLVTKTSNNGLQIDYSNWVVWYGDAWRVTSRGFVWWVSDNVITKTRRYLTWEEWLNKKEFEGLLTRDEKEKLSTLARSIPKPVISGAIDIGKMLLAEVLKSA